MPRNGKGGGYPNRTDLNTAAPTGDDREWGSRQRDEAAMDAVPVQPQEVPGRTPGDRGSLLRPTERPNAPVTSGVDIGPGPGSDALMTSPARMQERSGRRAGMYARKLVALTGDPVLEQFLRRTTRGV